MYMPVDVRYGRGTMIANKDVFAKYGERFLVVCGGSSAEKSGVLGDLGKCGIDFGVFDRIGPNPLLSVCREAGTLAREGGFDCIIGAGGGSALDAAKAVAIFAANPSMKAEEIYKRDGCAAPLPVICVGTTAGTGSEVTGVSVLTNDATGYKQSISGKDCYAKVSFCDFGYTASMPLSLTVTTALDAFAHATESYLASTADEFSRAYAAKAIPPLFGILRSLAAGEEPTVETREKQYLGSLYAGLAINISGCLFPHTLGYALTENFGIPHGRACAAFHPYLVKKAEQHAPDRMNEIFAMTSADRDEYLSVIGKLTSVRTGMTDSEIAELAARWKNGNKNFAKTPGGISAEDITAAFGAIK